MFWHTKELQFTTRASPNRFLPRKCGSCRLARGCARQKRVARRIPHRLWRALVWNDAPVASRLSFSLSLAALCLLSICLLTCRQPYIYRLLPREGGRAGKRAGALLCALKGRANSLTANFSCKLLPWMFCAGRCGDSDTEKVPISRSTARFCFSVKANTRATLCATFLVFSSQTPTPTVETIFYAFVTSFGIFATQSGKCRQRIIRLEAFIYDAIYCQWLR